MATNDEHDNVKHIQKFVPRDKLTNDGTILSHTWTMKNKYSNWFKATLNTCGYRKKDE